MAKRVTALVLFACFIGSATAGDFVERAHTPPDSPFHAIGDETLTFPRTSIEYEGRATISAKYRFVFDEEYGYEQNPHLFLEPSSESQSQLPYLTRGVYDSDGHPTQVILPERAKEIWVTNVAEAALALLGKQLAQEVFAGKHEKVIGEAVVVIEEFSAGYECESPFFGTRFVEVKREISPPSATQLDVRGC